MRNRTRRTKQPAPPFHDVSVAWDATSEIPPSRNPFNPGPLEKDIEKKVCDYAKSLGCYCRKFTSPSMRSVPDRMFITPNGVLFFIEFKRKTAKATDSQLAEIRRLEQHHQIVAIIDNVEDGKEFVNGILSL